MCIDIAEKKVARVQQGESPIYEPGLDDIMERSIDAARLHFTTSHEEGFAEKEVILLDLDFKPNTDDMGESPAIDISRELRLSGAEVTGYDPIAMGNAPHFIPDGVTYDKCTEKALQGADAAIFATDWDEFKDLNMSMYENLMETPLLFDGRNTYSRGIVATFNVEYYSVGRKPVNVREKVDVK
jgi:UDPglucose 6-dehydrogenase